MTPQEIEIDNFDYPLPDGRIALHPLAERDRCKLLCYSAADGKIEDTVFARLPEIMPADALIVFNNTRVINARLRFTKASGAAIEIFCLEPWLPADYERSFAARGECSWTCLVGNSKRWKEGELTMPLTIGGADVRLTASRSPEAPDKITFRWNGEFTFSDIIGAAGEIPIPPYLNRQSEASDATDYQTVFNRIEGSVAAPTAGLHFTDELLDAIAARGIGRADVTLHVGAGTFRPVKSEKIGDHDMHSEFITVPAGTIDALIAALEAGRTIVAVGTTSVRTVESLCHIGDRIAAGRWTGELPQWAPYDGAVPQLPAAEALRAVRNHIAAEGDDHFSAYTRIIIAPGYSYRVVGAMVTNFHQPKSTLLLLVSAFIGDAWRDLYAHALDAGYRFLSYGDACFFSLK